MSKTEKRVSEKCNSQKMGVANSQPAEICAVPMTVHGRCA